MTAEKRRQYGTGSVYRRASDGRWMGVIQIGWNARGRRRTVSVSGKTEAEAKRKLRDKQKDIDKTGAPVEGIGSQTTVKTWCEQWIDTKSRHLRPASRSGYVSAVNAWIIPTIGKRRLADLTPGHVRSVAKAVQAAGNTSTHAAGVQKILQRSLKDAIAEGHSVPERLLQIVTPGAAVSDRTAIPIEDALRLLEVAAGRHGGSRWVAALLQGMRQGECLGLTWKCVDLDGATVDVSWQLQSIPWAHGCAPENERPTCGRRYARGCPKRHHVLPDDADVIHLEGAWHLTRPKTSSGRRIIPLVPWMVEALRTWQDEAPASRHDLVWPRLDGRPQDKKVDDADWRALQAAAKTAHPKPRPWTLHEARHTTATLLLEAEVDPETVKAILGHSDIATSRNYQHVSQALARQAMEKLAERLQLVAPIPSL